MFQYKEDEKRRAEVKLTVLFKKVQANSEVQKQRTLKCTKQIEIHQSQIRGPLSCEGEKAPILQILMTSQNNPKSKDVFDIAGRMLSETGVMFTAKPSRN